MLKNKDFDAKAKAKAERGLAKVEKQVRAADARGGEAGGTVRDASDGAAHS